MHSFSFLFFLPMALTLDTKVVADKDQLSTELNGQSVIMNVDTGTYYSLNPVGSVIWRVIQEPATLRQVSDQVIAEFDVDAVRAQADVIKLVQDLVASKLAQVV
ncbi:MAG: hypothetical protein JWM04_1548 [Verrucomicrobiales bacterium]|nr:hypothetical protein [Verrucomicrobiales bacterium]